MRLTSAAARTSRASSPGRPTSTSRTSTSPYPQANILFLGLNWSVFDGGARHAARRQADLAIEKTRARDRRRQAEPPRSRSSGPAGTTSRPSAKAVTARSNTVAAEENLRIVEDQYKAGLARTTDVLDAEALLAESRFAVANQHYTAYLRQGALLGTAGVDLVSFFGAAAASTALAASKE